MGRLREIFKSTFLAAAGVVLPLALLLIIFEKIVSALSSVATPIAESLFPAAFAKSTLAANLATLFLLLVVSLLLGLFAQTRVGEHIGHWIESHTFMHFKIYRSIKEFSERLIPSHDNKLFRPALLTRKDEMNALIFVVEDLDADHFVIFVPSAPSTLSGSTFIVPKSDVLLLDIPALEEAKVFTRWGVGSSKIISQAHVSAALQGRERSLE